MFYGLLNITDTESVFFQYESVRAGTFNVRDYFFSQNFEYNRKRNEIIIINGYVYPDLTN